MSTKPKIDADDLKNIIKIGNKLSEEQIGEVLSELKEDPDFFDIDKSLSATLVKFNELYGDESIHKVKFIMDKYKQFNNDKQFEARMKLTDDPSKLNITPSTVIKKDGVIIGVDEFRKISGKEYDVKFTFIPGFQSSNGVRVSMGVKEVILTSIGSDGLDGKDMVDPDDPGTSLSIEI